MIHDYSIEQTRLLAQREALTLTESHAVWRLESGAVRIDSTVNGDTETLVRLAMPGDVLGIEGMLGVKDSFTVRAITPSRLVRLDLTGDAMTHVLKHAVVTGYQRSRDMVTLRTGSAEERVKSLLFMLVSPERGFGHLSPTCALPTLGDIATIVHAAPETVCRVLAALRQASFLQDCSPVTAKHRKLELRTHRLLGRGAAKTNPVRLTV